MWEITQCTANKPTIPINITSPLKLLKSKKGLLLYTAHHTYLAIMQVGAEPSQETRDIDSKQRGWGLGYGNPGLPDGPNLTVYHCLAARRTGAEGSMNYMSPSFPVFLHQGMFWSSLRP